jgi:hypothetical protein
LKKILMKIYRGVQLTYLNVLGDIKENNCPISGSDGTRELSLLRRTSVTEFITDRVSGIIVDAIDTAVAPMYEASTMNSSAFRADFEESYTGAHCPGNSKPAEQNQNQHDNEYQAESAAAVIAGPVERPAPKPAKAPEQRDYQYDEEDSSKRHSIISRVRLYASSRWTHVSRSARTDPFTTHLANFTCQESQFVTVTAKSL